MKIALTPDFSKAFLCLKYLVSQLGDLFQTPNWFKFKLDPVLSLSLAAP